MGELFIDVVSSLLSVADRDVLSDFFNSEVCESIKDNRYVNDETRTFLSDLVNKQISWKREDNYGGEGMGDDYWSVYSFSKDDQKVYIKFDGYYQSYNGAEFDEFYQVEPKQVTVTQFHRV